MNNFFNINRFNHLVRRQFLLNNKTFYIAIASMSAILYVIFTLIAIDKKSCMYSEQVNTFYTFYFIAGYIFTSRIFNELSDYRMGYQYLTLPASNFEKLMSGWIFTSFIYSITGILIVIIITTLANLTASLIMGFQFHSFDYNLMSIIKVCGVYIVTQSVFILGSTAFKKHPFLKTILAMFIAGMILSIVSGLLAWGIIGNFRFPHYELTIEDFDPGLVQFFEDTIPVVFKIIFWYLTVPFFLLASYFKLKESEV